VQFRRCRNLANNWLSVFLLAVVMPHQASAWTWANKVTVYNGAGLCVQGDAGIDVLKPNTFSGNLAYDETYALTEGCGAGLDRPDGWAAARLDVYKWTGSTWALCRGTNWKYGATVARLIQGDLDLGPQGPAQVLDYGGSSSCGSGYYGTLAFAYVWDGSAWRGGSVWSGSELAP
jgi:hypothetical protein